jgi:hypothetical protein
LQVQVDTLETRKGSTERNTNLGSFIRFWIGVVLDAHLLLQYILLASKQEDEKKK